MKITFDPQDSADCELVTLVLRHFGGDIPQPPVTAAVVQAPVAPAPVPVPQAAPAAPVPCAPVAPPPAAPAAAPPAAAPTVPPPSSEHEAGRQRLTEIVAKLGPAGNQVGALLTQVGAQSVSGLTLEQLRWVLAEAEKMVPPA